MSSMEKLPSYVKPTLIFERFFHVLRFATLKGKEVCGNLISQTGKMFFISRFPHNTNNYLYILNRRCRQ